MVSFATMKIRSFLIAALLLLAAAATAIAQVDDAALASAPRVTIDEFKQLWAGNNALIIDVRDPQKYAEGHIPGALSMPLDDLMARVPELKKASKPILVYCA